MFISQSAGRLLVKQPCIYKSGCVCAVRLCLMVCVMCHLTGQGGPYSPEGAALGGYGLDGQAHLGLRTAGTVTFREILHVESTGSYQSNI